MRCPSPSSSDATRSAHRLRQLDGRVEPRLGREDQELLAPPADHVVGGAEQLSEAMREIDQDPVAGAVPVGVVQRLKRSMSSMTTAKVRP
jgi:hypothetical protein